MKKSTLSSLEPWIQEAIIAIRNIPPVRNFDKDELANDQEKAEISAESFMNSIKPINICHIRNSIKVLDPRKALGHDLITARVAVPNL